MLDTKTGPHQNGRKRGRPGKTNGKGADGVDHSIIHLLHRASQRAAEIFAVETKEFDLTARQYAVITTVAAHEGLSQTDLVRMTGIDRSTLADVVQRLLKRGVIQRERTTRDGRTYAVSLSDEGRDLLVAIRPFAKKADKAVVTMLGNENTKAIASQLAKLAKREDTELPATPGEKEPVKNGKAGHLPG
jgi:DNA-binding MarR family transcriptional regulator